MRIQIEMIELLESYLSNKITTPNFCDVFYIKFHKEGRGSELKKLEYIKYEDMCNVTARYSEFEEDHKNCPGAFYTEEDVRRSAEHLFNELKKNNFSGI